MSVDAGGLSFTQPVSLSRDQRVALNVTSYLDVALVGGAIGAILLGLLLVRRPRLRAAIRDRLQHVREQLRRAGQGATGLPDLSDRGGSGDPGFGAGIPGRIVFRHRWRRFFPARAQGRVRSASRSGSRWGGPREGSEDQASRAAGRSQPAGPGASPWRGSTGGRRRRGARGHTGAETPADIPAEAPADIPAEAPAGTTPSLGRPPGTGRANCHSRQQQHRTALGGRRTNDGPDGLRSALSRARLVRISDVINHRVIGQPRGAEATWNPTGCSCPDQVMGWSADRVGCSAPGAPARPMIGAGRGSSMTPIQHKRQSLLKSS